MNNNYYCIIMAGGMGRRFWPYNRKALPKQFLDFLAPANPYCNKPSTDTRK